VKVLFFTEPPKIMKTEALMLINMGGPTHTGQVPGYMRSIFEDPAILPVPGMLRGLLASFYTSRRTPGMVERYNRIGGGSPLKRHTERLVDNVRRLEAQSDRRRSIVYAFRYTSPLIPDVINRLHREGHTRLRILPLFPHYNGAMAGSILREVKEFVPASMMSASSIRSWWHHREIIELQRTYLRETLAKSGRGARVLFVAHGIPRRNVERGEDYPDQVARSAEQVAACLPDQTEWSLAYQSRMEPVKWTGPDINDEIDRLSVSPAPLVLMPLSFVADCLETLYGLDIVAFERARLAGINNVIRVPVFNDDDRFAKALLSIADQD
jgi:ferrochelatase